MCEEEKCLWPFGYEDVKFTQRRVGEIWSCYWKDYKPTSRLKENVSVPTKLSLCEISTASESKSTPEQLITSLDIHGTGNSVTSNRRNITESESVFTNSSANKLDDIPYIKTEEQSDEDDNILNKNSIIPVNSTDLNDLVDNNEDVTRIKTEPIDPLNIDVEGNDDVSVISVKNVKETPKITSIERTNINISNVKMTNKISVYKDLGQKLLKVKKPVDIKGSEFISESKSSSYSKSIKNNDTVLKSNLSVTKMEIDGLPPITLTYEIPEFTTVPETISNLKLCHKANDTKPINSEPKSTYVKRNLNSGKHYEKFSFNTIKKKMGSSKANDNSSGNTSSRINTNSGTQEVEHNSTSNTEKADNSNHYKSNIVNYDNKQAALNANVNMDTVCTSNHLTNSVTRLLNQETINNKEAATNVDTACVSNQLSNSMTRLSNLETVASDTEAVNISANIDSFLDDLLGNDHSVSEDINDDWLNSLLN